jgi:hypothetical protein
LIQAFGTKVYTPCWTDLSTNISIMLNQSSATAPKDLPTWINMTVSQSDINDINAVFLSKGINYSF